MARKKLNHDVAKPDEPKYVNMGNEEEASQYMTQINESLDSLAGDPSKWSDFCGRFNDLYRRDRQLETEEANELLGFGNSPTDASMQVMRKYMTRYMRVMCFQPLFGGIGQPHAISTALGRYLAFTAVTAFFNKKDGVTDAEKRQKQVRQERNEERGIIQDKLGGYNFKRPLTQKNAAMLNVAFITSTYYAMREPDADIHKLQEDFQQARASLFDAARQDGISAESLSRGTRILVGQMTQRDINMVAVFNEMESHEVSMSEFRPVRTKEGAVEYRWDGDFNKPDGEAYKGCFTPRPPKSLKDHHGYMFDSIYEEFEDCNTLESIKDKSKEYFESGHSKRDSAVCAAAMMNDGYSDEDIKSVSLHAYMDVLCEKDLEMQLDYLSEDNPQTQKPQRCADMFLNDTDSYSFYKAYFNDYISEKYKDSPYKDYIMDAMGYRERTDRGWGDFSKYSDDYEPDFATHFRDLKDDAVEHKYWDNGVVKPEPADVVNPQVMDREQIRQDRYNERGDYETSRNGQMPEYDYQAYTGPTYVSTTGFVVSEDDDEDVVSTEQHSGRRQVDISSIKISEPEDDGMSL